uniref:Transcriptional adapter n=1 Tax=Ciona intestinalis TaxID=7719 RepID=F6VKM8_CIOIN
MNSVAQPNIGSDNENELGECKGCGVNLVEPYVRCAECENFKMCLECFSRGFESEQHLNNHKYQIITNKFAIFEFGWNADEEIKLLESLADCGPGNWNSISAQVKTKSAVQCEAHYMKCYVINAKYPLPAMFIFSLEMPDPPIRPPSIPIPFKPCEDPCRPLPESHRAQNMAGYLAARGDFQEEYDNYAEWDISDIYFSPDDKPILKNLKLAVVKIYQSRLQERARRKHIIRKFGLINNSNHMLRYLRKLPQDLREVEEKMRPLMHIQSHPIAHDMLLQSIGVELELKKKIKKLQNYRRNGISSFRVAKMFEKLKVDRESSKSRSNHMSEILPYLHDPAALAMWLQRQAAIEAGLGNTVDTSLILPTMRKTAPPIDLTDLPGVEKLNAVEKEFCAKARLVPEAYLTYKASLIHEFSRNGKVKLAGARSIVKIDVNKTRKLYDFLIDQGHINT